MKLLHLLLITLQYIFSYKIISRNYVVVLDGSTNKGKIIETVQYDFENLSIPITVKKHYPHIEGNITNVTVSSKQSNVITSWSSQKNGSENYFLVNVAKNINSPVTIEYIYFTIGVMNPNNLSINMIVSNYESQSDLNSKIDVILQKIHGLITPSNIILDKNNYEFGYFYDHINDLAYNVRVDKNTAITTNHEVILAKRENKLKKEEEKSKNYKISFNEQLKKGEKSQIKFRVETQKPKGGGGSSKPMTRPPPPVKNSEPAPSSPPPSGNSAQSGKEKKYTNSQEQTYTKRKRSSGSNSVWEAIIAFLYVACLIFLCYECCTYCCGSGDKAGEGEYIYVCNQ